MLAILLTNQSDAAMAITLWCWRCKTDVQMLDEVEWREIEPLLDNVIEDIKKCGEERGPLLAKAARGDSALAKYKAFTGFAEAVVTRLWHHRASLYGGPCKRCAKPLRSPNARHCAECGYAGAT